METRLVLIEKEDKGQSQVTGCSGVMLNKKYIITTGNVISDIDLQDLLEKLEPGKLHTGLFSNYNSTLNAVWTKNGLYTVKKACILAVFTSRNIKDSNKHIFKNWAIDSIDNNRNLNKILSLFVVLSFEKDNNIVDIKSVLKEWWNLLAGVDFSKGDTLGIRSVPFGNRDFIDSYSKGIVSNIFGNNSCLILSDCPSTPGSEGSPVYIFNSKNFPTDQPVGLILASVSWWKGEWVGLTLIVDIKTVLLELIDIPINTDNVRNTSPKVIATTEFSIVQVHCGNNWGTAILLNEEKGIFITNSHVIVEEPIQLFYKGRSWSASLIYKTLQNNVLDVALIESEKYILKILSLRQVNVTKKKCDIGDTVYSAGFSLFTMDCHPTPTLSRGCISQKNPFMLKTTCSIHPGASGGAILDEGGNLLGVIVCNIKLNENHVVYPRVNVAIPVLSIVDTIFKYIESEDLTILNSLNTINREAEAVWRKLDSKI